MLFTGAGIYVLWKIGHVWGSGLLALGIFFATSAVFAPKVLQPLNELWFQFGVLLGRFVSPVILGLMFFLLITPVAVCMRLVNRDALRMKKRKAPSYWLDRDPVGPAPESYTQQF